MDDYLNRSKESCNITQTTKGGLLLVFNTIVIIIITIIIISLVVKYINLTQPELTHIIPKLFFFFVSFVFL